MSENDSILDPEYQTDAEHKEQPLPPLQPAPVLNYTIPSREAAPQQPVVPQQDCTPQQPAAPKQDSTPQQPTAPQRVDYTRPTAPYGSYSYIPQQPGNYRPSAAPRPAAQPSAQQNASAAPVNPQNPPVNPQSTPANAQSAPVNPYSAQGRYTPPQYVHPSYSAPQNSYYAPRSTYNAPASTQNSETHAEPKKEKKKASGVRIAVIALCCALVGSILGGGIVGFAMHSFYSSDAAVSAAAPSTDAAQPSINTAPASAPSTVAVDPSGRLSPAQIYEANVGAIVGIANEGTSYNVFGQASKTASSGTGFIISADGEILTNYHVVDGAQTLTVTMHDGSSYNAIVLGYEAESDVALLKIEASSLPTVTLGNSDYLNVGDEVAAIGNPLGELTYTMTTGIVSSMDRDVNTDGTPINMMQIDAAINPGNSGGPLFDMNGNVIGITTAKYSGTLNSGATIEGIGFAIPINDVLSILDDLRENGTVPNRAYIGITVSTVAASEAMQTPAGAQVATVTEGSSGANAGLQPGDIITAVNDTEIKSVEDLSKALKSFRAGDSAQLTVFRNGSELTLTISFDAKPAATEPAAEETVPQETESFNPWEFFLP